MVDVLSPWCSLVPSRMLDAGVCSICVTESARRATRMPSGVARGLRQTHSFALIFTHTLLASFSGYFLDASLEAHLRCLR